MVLKNKMPTAVANNDLCVDFSILLDYTSYLHISNWQQGIGWTLYYDDWTEHGGCYKEAPLPLSYILTIPDYQPWVQSIPAIVLQKIKPYSENEFSLLYLCSRYPSVYELFLSAPTLVWLLIRQAKAQHWAESRIASLSQQKRTYIAQVCGLPGTPLAVKILQRLVFSKFGVSALNMIGQLFGNMDYRQLSHAQIIDDYLIRLLLQYPQLSGSHLVATYRPDLWQYRDLSVIDDCQRMMLRLGRQESFEQIGRCTNREQLRDLHDRLAARLNKKPALPAVAYAPPPVPGTETIIPITHSKELSIEGWQMKHCVASYHADIITGRYYVYRITHPQRATLGLTLSSGKKPCIDQLKGVRNQCPSQETYDSVQEWLEKALEQVEGESNGR